LKNKFQTGSLLILWSPKLGWPISVMQCDFQNDENEKQMTAT